MALGRSEDLTTRLMATNQASAEIRKVSDEMDKLSGRVALPKLSTTDNASDDIKAVGDRLDRLDGTTATATVTADDRASSAVRAISDRLKDLSDEDVLVVLKAEGDDAQRELDKLTKSLRNVQDMADDEVEVRLSARDEVSAKVAAARREIATVSGRIAEARLLADDQVSPKVRAAEAELRDLDGQLAQARLDVIDNLTGDVQAAEARLADLDGRRARASLELDKARFDAELREALLDINRVDGRTANAKIEAANRASSELLRVQREIDALDGESATVNVDARGLDGVLDKLGSLPGALGQVGGSIGNLLKSGGGLTAAAGAAGGIATAFLSAANYAADLAIEADEIARLTGGTVEQASGLAGLWKQTGADVNDLADVLLQMNGVLLDDADVAKQLGINLNDGRNITERFVQVVEAIGRSTLGSADKAKLMSAAFGEEGVRQVNRLTSSIGFDLAGAIDDLPDELIQSDEDVKKARDLRNEVTKITTEFQALAAELGGSVIPLLKTAVDLVQAATSPEVQGSSKVNRDIFGLKGNWDASWRYIFDDAPRKVGTWETEIERAFGDAGVAADAFEVRLAGAGEALGRQADEARRATNQLIPLGAAWEQVARNLAAPREVPIVGAALRGVDVFDEFRKAAQLTYETIARSGDWGKAALEGGLSGMQKYSTQMGALKDITAGYEAAMDNLVAAVGEGAVTFDVATEAGRRNRDALKEVAGALNVELAAAYDGANGNMDVFKDRATELGERTLRRLRDELGLDTDQVNALRVELGLTEGDYEARFKLAGAEEARMKIGLLQSSIDDLPTDVETRVNQRIINGDYVGALAEIEWYYAQNPANLPTDTYGRDVDRGRREGQSWLDRVGSWLPVDTWGRDVDRGRRDAQQHAARYPVEAPVDTVARNVEQGRYDAQRHAARYPVQAPTDTYGRDVDRGRRDAQNWFDRAAAWLPVDSWARDYGKARDDISWFYNRYPVGAPVATYPTNLNRTWGDIYDWFAGNPIPIAAKIPGVGVIYGASGGTAPPNRVMIAGENNRPEFVNGRLVTGPTVVPPGGRVRGEASTQALMERLVTALNNATGSAAVVAQLDRVIDQLASLGGGSGGGSSPTFVSYNLPAGADPLAVERARREYIRANGS